MDDEEIYTFPMSFFSFLKFAHYFSYRYSPSSNGFNTKIQDYVLAGDQFLFTIENFMIVLRKRTSYDYDETSLGLCRALEYCPNNSRKVRLEIQHLMAYPSIQMTFQALLTSHVMGESFFRTQGYCLTKVHKMGKEFCPILLHNSFIFEQLLQNIPLKNGGDLIL